ncbi:MAG: tetratricopeptide repeat protein [Gemmataceae bacterium]|nr:tetratricopeptide repeat protein [Gemmata sp.]MDW8199175.1 tetratricopeptide repeat protein [Gemmataceae bacterium]
MKRSKLWVVVGLSWAVAIGCKGTDKLPALTTGLTGTETPPLLVGPDAAAKAPAPVELPAKEKAHVCFRTAQFFEKDGRIEDAIRMYEQARATDPALQRPAARRLAVLYDKIGDFTRSTTEYEALLKEYPKDADLLTDYGYSHYCRGDWAKAEDALRKAVQIDPQHKKAWINLGLAQAQMGQYDEGYRSFCKAVREPDAHCNIAFVLATQGKIAEAKDRYRLALSLDPNLRAAQIGLGYLENPPQVSEKPTHPRREKFDPVAAAAQVPTVAEIEARLKKTESGTFVVLPRSYGKIGESD